MKIHLEFDDQTDNLGQIAPLLRAVADEATKIVDPPLTDAEIGEAQANVADFLTSALLTVARVPDINNVERLNDAANFAAALRMISNAGREADKVLSRYSGEWVDAELNTNPAVTDADIIMAAAKAAQVEANRVPETEVEPHSNS